MVATVIYTPDLEPITIIDVPMWALKRMKAGEPIVFPAWEEVSFRRPTEPPSFEPIRTVCIWAEPFVRGDTKSVILFTKQYELALLLRSSVLPGQRKTYEEKYKEGFIKGLLMALGGE